jgi:hypothetical protein
MQFPTVTSLLTLIAIAHSTLATDMQGCFISHNAGDGGNQTWENLPASVRGNVCGAFNSQIQSVASSESIQLKGSVTCQTSDPAFTMFTQLTLNKQSCSVQIAAIMSAMSLTLSNAGGLSGSSVCSTADC